ncbi:hypothetical protein F4804DRAFT_332691 [Jackrogersella minutella]|nr:hypothetical protein F4804DRAFT_332691 [Jackrogersella minutella]
MSCRMPECHFVRPNGSRSTLDHDKNTAPGVSFYYCSIHRVYHCIAVKTHRRLPQPLCGECAWLFFAFPKEAAKYKDSDIPATTGPDDGGGDPRGGMFGCEDHATSVTDGMDLDGIKRSLPNIEDTLDDLSRRVYDNDIRPQRNDQEHARNCRNSTSGGQDAPSAGE